jgi:ATP-dependent helicase HrpA
VFEPSTVAGVRRRVILATNVAETSLTVPGIRYVVDAGTARISRYSARSKIQQLPIEAVSQASAQQRSGAPGAPRRHRDPPLQRGRLPQRPEYTEPEILRTSLASVILQMLALGFGDIEEFPFLTKPDSRGVKAAFDLLTELRAVSARAAHEARPRDRPPADRPRFARMLIEARRLGVLPTCSRSSPGCRSRTSASDPRPRTPRRRAGRPPPRALRRSDERLPLLLNLWNHLQEQQRDLGSSAFRRLCRSEFLNYVRVREWFDVHRQLRQLLGAKAAPPRRRRRPALVHRAILAGLSHIGILDTRSLAPAEARRPARAQAVATYRGARGASFAIFPGRRCARRRPTRSWRPNSSRRRACSPAPSPAIDPAWAEELAGDLAHRQLSDPHWSKDAGAAVAAEKVTLFGVEIIPRPRVQLARIDRRSRASCSCGTRSSTASGTRRTSTSA